MDQLKTQSDRSPVGGEVLEESTTPRRAAQHETPDTTAEDADAESHIIRGMD
ncbi:hypothetical protein [Streptomyces sp. UNOC14_S4]|uniref:hypothetical protein n=1 Tax=Streptomyces sp. UNOC14_S4 TaxID=2872340 RepID=UPI001E50F6EF|nr:hypothetical protein [Streptomyces sp. UNOC14_S4]MCC3769301.1 hypothetical protein [Streptomyces sp. UNOC14_S4]